MALLFTRTAQKRLAHVPKAERDQIMQRLREIAASPDARHSGTTRLVNTEGAWRVRQGDWRGVYEIAGEDVVVIASQRGVSVNLPTLHVIAETSDTVTVRRADLDRLIDAAEDALDAAAARRFESDMAERGRAAVLAKALGLEELERIWAGEHPLRIWREKRGLTQRGLSDLAGVSQSYLAEVESARKPGSVAALRQLASALGVQVDDLIAESRSKE
jgi:mRNA-degrading endonuclease RelE of RelBE toxin-antitoxin system